MNQGMKGIEVFLAGWMIALVTHYLGGLDLGAWLPLLITGVEAAAVAMILFGIHGFHKSHKNFNAATPISVAILCISIAKAGFLIAPLKVISPWIALSATSLVLADDILFMILSGFMLLGFTALYTENGEENGANRLRKNWILFLVFSVLYLVIQISSVFLVNESVWALTYAVPISGLPMLIAGGVAVWRLASN